MAKKLRRTAHIPSPGETARAMEILMGAREELLSIDPMIALDTKLFQDMLEGEGGDAMDILANIVRQGVEADAMAEMIKARRAMLADRQDRFEKRREVLRRRARDALIALDLPLLETEDFTASITAGKTHVIITNEKALPDGFCRFTRAPNKDEIGEALRAGGRVEGAELSNPEPGMTVRLR